jgi:hypothetical protein
MADPDVPLPGESGEECTSRVLTFHAHETSPAIP